MAAGSISENKFQELAAEFENISRIKNDVWNLRRVGLEGYFSIVHLLCGSTIWDNVFLTKKINQEIPTKAVQMEELLDQLEENELEDSACLPAPASSELESVACEYHVVYSASYGVPVLYFNMMRHNGQRLSLEEIWERVPGEFQDTVELNRWSTLTQQEHPILGVPFFQLHPCHTQKMMKESADIEPTGNYLVRWLSAVGPVVGLKMPLSFGIT